MKNEITPFDLFAAAALQGVIANSYQDKCNEGTGAARYVEEAEHIANAMMESREARDAGIKFGEFIWERVKAQTDGDMAVAHAGGRDVDHWALIAPSGKRAATVWDNGTWHTWDDEGVGADNSTETSAEYAKWAAYCSVLGHGVHGYGPIVTRK
jgi:hypothetical protein